jgi:hypothetical protein
LEAPELQGLLVRRSLTVARPGDTVLLAGKGHERTMLVAHGPEPWDEREEAIAALVDMGWTGLRPRATGRGGGEHPVWG